MAPIERTTSGLRSRQIARAFDELELNISIMELRQVQMVLSQLERQLVSITKGAGERRELHRRTVERYANECLERRAPWSTTYRAIRLLDQAGYTIVDRRIHLAILLGMYAAKLPIARNVAFARIADATWRLRKLPRGNRYRRHYERRLAQSVSELHHAA